MSDRNEWFKDVKRLVRGLEVETVEDPFAWPTVTSVADGEDVLHALGLHPLSTATLFADSGMECTVQRYEYLLGAGVWRACCDEGVVRVDEMHLTCPDTFGALMVDIKEAMHSPDICGGPATAYSTAVGLCKDCNFRCTNNTCQYKAFQSILERIGSLLTDDGE